MMGQRGKAPLARDIAANGAFSQRVAGRRDAGRAASSAVPVLAESASEQRQAFGLIGAAIPLTLRK